VKDPTRNDIQLGMRIRIALVFAASVACGNRLADDGSTDSGSEVTSGESGETSGPDMGAPEPGPPCSIETTFEVEADPQWNDAAGAVLDDGDEIAVYGVGQEDGGTGFSLWRARYDHDGAVAESDRVSLSAGPAESVALHGVVQAQGTLVAAGIERSEGVDPVGWVLRLDPSDLSELWRVELPLADTLDARVAVSGLAGGDLVVGYTGVVSDGDEDVFVRRLARKDGSTQWEVSHSGPSPDGYSLDELVGVDVGVDDRVYGVGLIRKAYNVHETTLLELSPADGSLVDATVVMPDPGDNHDQLSGAIAAGEGGGVFVGLGVESPGEKFDLAHVFEVVDGEVVWEYAPDTFGPDSVIGRRVRGLHPLPDGGVFVAGELTVVDSQDFLVPQAWHARLDADGQERCLFVHPIEDGVDRWYQASGLWGSDLAALVHWRVTFEPPERRVVVSVVRME
jgi:hypothetical protein